MSVWPLFHSSRPFLYEGPIAAANNTNQNTAVMDMNGYAGLIVIASITDCFATGVAGVKIQGGTLADGSDMANLSDSAANVTVTCAVDDDLNAKGIFLASYLPDTKRYARINRNSVTANIAFGDLWVFQYKDQRYFEAPLAAVVAAYGLSLPG